MAPANVPLVLTVGAYTEATEGTSTWASSNYGRCVDLWAPGTNINASLAVGEDIKSGTSMAAPQVAGAVGLLRGLFPHWDAYQTADELLSASVPRSILDWGRALDVGRQQWSTRFFDAYGVAPLVDLGIWSADSVAVSKDGANLCARVGGDLKFGSFVQLTCVAQLSRCPVLTPSFPNAQTWSCTTATPIMDASWPLSKSLTSRRAMLSSDGYGQ